MSGAIFGFICAGCPAFAQTSFTSSVHVAHALLSLEKFKQTHDVSDLRESVDKMYVAVDPAPGTDPEPLYLRRRAVLKGYVSLFEEIDPQIDPSFSPEDPRWAPANCLVPPPEKNGTQLPSCADPNDIRDASVRQEYVAAIAANERKKQRYAYQVKIQQLAKAALVGLKLNLENYRVRDATFDAPALNAIVENGNLSETRKKQIELAL